MVWDVLLGAATVIVGSGGGLFSSATRGVSDGGAIFAIGIGAGSLSVPLFGVSFFSPPVPFGRETPF